MVCHPIHLFRAPLPSAWCGSPNPSWPPSSDMRGHTTSLSVTLPQAQGPQEPSQEAPRQVPEGAGAAQGRCAGCWGGRRRSGLWRRGHGYQVACGKEPQARVVGCYVMLWSVLVWLSSGAAVMDVLQYGDGLSWRWVCCSWAAALPCNAYDCCKKSRIPET